MKSSKPRSCHPLLKPLIGLVRNLGATLGPDYEIVLHDVSTSDPFIVEICHGELTGRTKEAPLTDFGSYLMRAERYADADFVANYASFAPDGRPMRSSVSIIRDEERKVVGFLCINYDLTRATMLRAMMEGLTTVRPLDAPDIAPEAIKARPEDRIRQSVEELKKARGGKPLRMASAQERLGMLQKLDEEGIFAIKGAVEAIGTELGKSPYTIYGDLRRLRSRH